MKQNNDKRGQGAARDPEKEKLFKELSQILGQAGYSVRREKLKQGYGWKVVSGSCRAQQNNLIFVDQKLPQDDQLSFLVGKIFSLNIPVSDTLLASFQRTDRRASCMASDEKSA